MFCVRESVSICACVCVCYLMNVCVWEEGIRMMRGERGGKGGKGEREVDGG